MDKNPFLTFFVETQKISQEEAIQCAEESVSKKQKVEDTLVSKGILTPKALKEYGLAFKDYALGTQLGGTESTITLSASGASFLEELQKFSRAEDTLVQEEGEPTVLAN